MNRVLQIVMTDELLNSERVELLPGLRLPGQDTVLANILIEVMIALTPPEGHEEDKVPRRVGNGNDPLQPPRPRLWREGRVRCENVMGFLA